MVKKVLIINGVERTIVVEGTESLAEILRPAAAHRMQDRLRGRTLRRLQRDHGRKSDPLLHHQDFQSTGLRQDRDHRGYRNPGGSSSPAGCLGSPRLRPVRILLTGIHHERQGSSGNNPSPTREEVRDWFNKTRNLCRCTGYKPLIDAVMDAARVLRGEITKEDLMFQPTDNKILHHVRETFRSGQGNGSLGFRSGRDQEAAGEHPADRPGAGGSFPCADQRYRHLRGGEDARRRADHYLQGCARQKPDHRTDYLPHQ